MSEHSGRVCCVQWPLALSTSTYSVTPSGAGARNVFAETTSVLRVHVVHGRACRIHEGETHDAAPASTSTSSGLAFPSSRPNDLPHDLLAQSTLSLVSFVAAYTLSPVTLAAFSPILDACEAQARCGGRCSASALGAAKGGDGPWRGPTSSDGAGVPPCRRDRGRQGAPSAGPRLHERLERRLLRPPLGGGAARRGETAHRRAHGHRDQLDHSARVARERVDPAWRVSKGLGCAAAGLREQARKGRPPRPRRGWATP